MQASLPQVHIDQLQSGIFVALDMGWLDHPFPVSSFLIKNTDQIATLRELGLQMVPFDPQRSHVEPLPLESAPSMAAAANITVENLRLMDEKRARTGRTGAHRERVQTFEKRYEESIASTKNILAEILRDPQLAALQAGTIAEQLTASFLDDPGATVMMVSSQKLDDLSTQHALNVMILTMLICKGLGVGREIMGAAGVGALLHDIGKTSISKTVWRKSQRNRSEETLYRLHGEYGLKIVGEHVNPGVRAVIRQHHECVDGTGFPKGSKGSQINPLARIVAIADRYDTLCNPLRIADAVHPAEAISTMFVREANRYDASMLAVLIRELGIYPPGSFVSLSNGSLGLVIAATSGNTLKPTVMVYEPGVPRNDAVVVNLTESTDIKIDGVLKPETLDRSVIDYLNPRMRLSYYVQNSES